MDVILVEREEREEEVEVEEEEEEEEEEEDEEEQEGGRERRGVDRGVQAVESLDCSTGIAGGCDERI